MTNLFLIILKIIKKIYDVIINLFVLIISLMVPKNDNILLFGSWFGQNFSDNSRYLYLYCSYNKEKFGLKKVIWVTDHDEILNELRDKNLEIYKKCSLKGIWYHLRAGYHFISQQPTDINPYFSVRAKRVQLWHGVGFKNIAQIDKMPDTGRMKYKLEYFIKFISYPGFWYKFIFLSTSEFATENIYKLSFRTWENKVIEGNYPRNIYLNEINVEDKYYLDKRQMELIESIKDKKSKGYKTIIYLPTYRNDAKLSGKNRKIYPLNIASELEFNDFQNFLSKNNIYFLSKFHFAGDLSLIDEQDNFKNLSSDLDIYPIMKYTDILLTDYSSIYADYLFLDKPIIFYPFDLSVYEKQDKGFLLDYNDVTPGKKVFDIESLKSQILYCLDKDDYKSERDKIKKLYFGKNIEDSFYSLMQKIQSKGARS